MGKQLIELCNVINLLVVLDSLLFTHMRLYNQTSCLRSKVVLRWPISIRHRLYFFIILFDRFDVWMETNMARKHCVTMWPLYQNIFATSNNNYSFLLISCFCRGCFCSTLNMTSQSIAAIEAYVDWIGWNLFYWFALFCLLRPTIIQCLVYEQCIAPNTNNFLFENIALALENTHSHTKTCSIDLRWRWFWLVHIHSQ